MSYVLQKVSAKLLFVDEGSFKAAAEAAKERHIPQSNLIGIGEKGVGLRSLQNLLAEGNLLSADQHVKPWIFEKGKSASDSCAFLSFSSGTTGLPKAVR